MFWRWLVVVLFTLYPDLMKVGLLLEDLEVQSQSTCTFRFANSIICSFCQQTL